MIQVSDSMLSLGVQQLTLAPFEWYDTAALMRCVRYVLHDMIQVSDSMLSLGVQQLMLAPFEW
jgi:hypothetical protein